MIVFKQVAKQILKNLHERVIMNHPSTSYNVNHNITNKKCVCVCVCGCVYVCVRCLCNIVGTHKVKPENVTFLTLWGPHDRKKNI